ncbi:hypothetical protein D3C87_1792510 [compost metagenome]
MIRQGHAQVVHDAVRALRQHLAEELGERRVAEVEEGGDGDDRPKDLEAEDETLN